MTPAELDAGVTAHPGHLLQVATERPDIAVALLDHAVDILTETNLLVDVRRICAAQQAVLATGGGEVRVEVVSDEGVGVYEATL